jgi:hypothetical protein
MARQRTWILTTALVLAAGCGTTAPAVDVREAHLARLPAEATTLAQLDMTRILDAQNVENWMSLMARMHEGAPDTACVAPLLARVGTVTHVMLPGTPAHGPDTLALLSGDLTAADLAACAAKLMGDPAAGLPVPSAEGVYVLRAHREEMFLADLTGGGVALGTEAGIAVALASQPPATLLSGDPLLARLRGLLPAGADVDFYLLEPMGQDEMQVDAAAASLRRGATDRYEFVLLAGSADNATTLSFMAMGLPLIVAQMQAMMEQAVAAPDTPPIHLEVFAKANPVLDGLRNALGNAQVTVEGDAVRIVLDVDPAVVGPTDLLFVAGMMLFTRGADVPETGPSDPPPAVVVPPEAPTDEAAAP